jgi:Xaa-Pro aminopeptidase
MDCGVRNEFGYCSDITRTIIDHNSPLQRQLFDMVKQAYTNCVKFVKQKLVVRIGVTLNQIEEICVQTLIHQFGKLSIDEKYKEWSKGIIHCRSNTPESRVFIRHFYTHFIGHGIGLETHDPMADGLLLKENCVFTIEPGLYFDKSKIPFSIPPKYYKIGGIRLEDMFMISTQKELICLTSNINPKI